MVPIIPAIGEPGEARAAVEQFLKTLHLMHLGVTKPDCTPLIARWG